MRSARDAPSSTAARCRGASWASPRGRPWWPRSSVWPSSPACSRPSGHGVTSPATPDHLPDERAGQAVVSGACGLGHEGHAETLGGHLVVTEARLDAPAHLEAGGRERLEVLGVHMTVVA